MDLGPLEYVTATVERRVATVTLNQPEQLNAYSVPMGLELFRTLHLLDRDDDVRAIVVTGAGRHFCAGAALAADGKTFAKDGAFAAVKQFEQKCQPWNMNTPVIAAINGAAVGIGATMPLLWDLRFCADDSKFGFVFTRRGILPEANSTWILPRLIGMAAAMDLLLTGRLVKAPEALSLGLVSRVVPSSDLLSEAQAAARDIAENTAPVSVAATKRLVWRQTAELDPARAKAFEDELFYWAGRQPDATEGVQSFLEKREPKWSMKPSEQLPEQLQLVFPNGPK